MYLVSIDEMSDLILLGKWFFIVACYTLIRNIAAMLLKGRERGSSHVSYAVCKPLAPLQLRGAVPVRLRTRLQERLASLSSTSSSADSASASAASSSASSSAAGGGGLMMLSPFSAAAAAAAAAGKEAGGVGRGGGKRRRTTMVSSSISSSAASTSAAEEEGAGEGGGDGAIATLMQDIEMLRESAEVRDVVAVGVVYLQCSRHLSEMAGPCVAF